ncbi:nuclear transport factor 2 family protein [Bradyrhizobium sp. Cp5.3]|uniref:nuclear transport factor 2 family protein n=1 Tax=Bradyrhizobium sp. Cp5.3 TaxID=443598 RepID=UPI00041CB848
MSELLDREAIRDCIYRYCRGIDRADEAALRSAYWPDATDQHGIYAGPVQGFFEWARDVFRTNGRSFHMVSNILIEFLDPDHAAVETYFVAFQRRPIRDGVVEQLLIAGRYCDCFEKRSDEWRVQKRVVVFDWIEEEKSALCENEEMRFGSRKPAGAKFPEDPIYDVISRSRGAQS